MPASTKKQLELIYAMRSKYKNKQNSPDKWKWVFDKEWTDDVKMNTLPEMSLINLLNNIITENK